MSLLVRSALTTLQPRRCLALSAFKRADQIMPDGVDHATGLIFNISCSSFNSISFRFGKYELLAKQAGNEDPFFLKAVQRGEVC